MLKGMRERFLSRVSEDVMIVEGLAVDPGNGDRNVYRCGMITGFRSSGITNEPSPHWAIKVRLQVTWEAEGWENMRCIVIGTQPTTSVCLWKALNPFCHRVQHTPRPRGRQLAPNVLLTNLTVCPDAPFCSADNQGNP